VAASDWANDIQLWDLVTGTQVQQLEPSEQYNVKPETMANVYSLAFSPDGKWLAAGGPNRVHIWETADFRRAYILRDISGGAYQVAFSPDNTRLATAGLDVRLWNFRRGQEVLRLEDHTSPVKSVSFSPNGQLLVTASTDATARLYDATPVPEPPPQTWREWWEQTWPGVVLGMGIVILLLIFILVFLVMRRLFRWIRRRFRKVTEPQPG
jgi:WD40 repeat protein